MKLFRFSLSCILMIAISLFALYGCIGAEISSDEDLMITGLGSEEDIDEQKTEQKNIITGGPSETKPFMEGNIRIAMIGEYTFDPFDISSIRDDLFKEGFFSVFDILLYLDNLNEIEMEYYFDNELNTYVIDTIDGIEGWWYVAYYDGGWPERNVYRMDHYPYKDKMSISIIEATADELDSYYDVFRQEIARKNSAKGNIIIPEVILRGPSIGDLIFEKVHIRAHGLRNDMLQDGTITAIDAILTLGEDGFIDYELFWYESIGTAEIVKNYWVNGINDDKSAGRCGFVYEEGSMAFYRFRGNHIHIPSDIRILNSPEYLEYFWICI